MLIIQVKVLKVYPWKHWSSVLTCVLGGVQTFTIGIIISRHKLAWQIGWNIQLLTIVYSVSLFQNVLIFLSKDCVNYQNGLQMDLALSTLIVYQDINCFIYTFIPLD